MRTGRGWESNGRSDNSLLPLYEPTSGERQGKKEHVPDSLRDPRSGSDTAGRKILAGENLIIIPGNFH